MLKLVGIDVIGLLKCCLDQDVVEQCKQLALSEVKWDQSEDQSEDQTKLKLNENWMKLNEIEVKRWKRQFHVCVDIWEFWKLRCFGFDLEERERWNNEISGIWQKQVDLKIINLFKFSKDLAYNSIDLVWIRPSDWNW